MTFMVDYCSDAMRSLEFHVERQAPSIEGLWYQAWRLSAKGH
jgi:hypothetical protein